MLAECSVKNQRSESKAFFPFLARLVKLLCGFNWLNFWKVEFFNLDKNRGTVKPVYCWKLLSKRGTTWINIFMSLNNGMVINFVSHYFAIIFFSWIRSTWSLSDSRKNLLHGLQVGYRYLKTQFSSKSFEQLLVACSSLEAWFLWKYLALFATFVRLLMGFSLAWVRFSPSPVTTYASRRRLPRHGLSTCVVTVLKFGHINVFFAIWGLKDCTCMNISGIAAPLPPPDYYENSPLLTQTKECSTFGNLGIMLCTSNIMLIFTR